MWIKSIQIFHSIGPTWQQLLKATVTKPGSHAVTPELYFTINEHLKREANTSKHNESGAQGIIAKEIQNKKTKNILRMQFAAPFVFIAQWMWKSMQLLHSGFFF